MTTNDIKKDSIKENIEKAEILIEALPYIQRFNGKVIVIKCGGSLMDDPERMAPIIEDVVLLKVVGFKPIIVHGGGKELDLAVIEKIRGDEDRHQHDPEGR